MERSRSAYSKKISLRESFMAILSKRSLIIKKTNRLRGLYLFRATVRLVLEYIDWLTEEPIIEEISDDIAVNIRMVQQKKVEKKALTLQDRSILLVNPENRTSVEHKYIFELFKKFRAFRKYPNDLRVRLAEVCLYQYLKPGRVIVRQGRKAENLYFIVNGEVSSSRIVKDRWTGESKEIDMGILQPGDIFGEIALLHTVPRTATVVTKTVVDLFFIPLKDFNEILRDSLTNEWNVLQDALVHFNYFKDWDEETRRECCILSRLKDFQADEVLLGDAKGMVNFVHFVLDGECRLIEHMIVREQFVANGVHYELYDPKDFATKDEKRSSKRSEATEKKLEELEYKYEASRTILNKADNGEDFADYNEHLPSSIDKRTDFERASIITTTLLDVVNEWHKITDVAEMLMKESSCTSQRYPSDARTIFMQICTFTRGACFGLGENMTNRRVVSTGAVRCFLIPRYWLIEHNRGNIWERVKLFMNSKFPTKEELFNKFIRNRRWLKYRKHLVEDVGKRGRRIHTNITIHDVPYSIRIVNDIGV